MCLKIASHFITIRRERFLPSADEDEGSKGVKFAVGEEILSGPCSGTVMSGSLSEEDSGFASSETVPAQQQAVKEAVSNFVFIIH